jgi:hypothetical protein
VSQLQGVVHDDTARAMLGVAGHAGLFAQSESVYRLARALLDCYHDAPSAPARALGLRSTTVRRFFQSPGIAGLPGTWGLGFDHPDPLLTGDAVYLISRIALVSAWRRTPGLHRLFAVDGSSPWLDRGVALEPSPCRVDRCCGVEQGGAASMLRPALHDAIHEKPIAVG